MAPTPAPKPESVQARLEEISADESPGRLAASPAPRARAHNGGAISSRCTLHCTLNRPTEEAKTTKIKTQARTRAHRRATSACCTTVCRYRGPTCQRHNKKRFKRRQRHKQNTHATFTTSTVVKPDTAPSTEQHNNATRTDAGRQRTNCVLLIDLIWCLAPTVADKARGAKEQNKKKLGQKTAAAPFVQDNPRRNI